MEQWVKDRWCCCCSTGLIMGPGRSMCHRCGQKKKVSKNVRQPEVLYTAGRSMQTTCMAFESGFLVRFMVSSILYLKENKNSNVKTVVLKKLIISIFQKWPLSTTVPKPQIQPVQDAGPAPGPIPPRPVSQSSRKCPEW